MARIISPDEIKRMIGGARPSSISRASATPQNRIISPQEIKRYTPPKPKKETNFLKSLLGVTFPPYGAYQAMKEIPEINRAAWPVAEQFLKGGAKALPLPEPRKVGMDIRQKLGMPEYQQAPERLPVTTPQKVARGAGAVTSTIGQFMIAGEIAGAVLGSAGKLTQYAKYATKLGVPVKDIYKAEKALGLVFKAAPKPWLKGAVQWGIHALPRLQAKDFQGKARELATTMITGGAFGKISMANEMKPIVKYLANVTAPLIIKSTVGGKPEEAKKDMKWYMAMALPALFAGGLDLQRGSKALVPAGQAPIPGVGGLPAPQAPPTVEGLLPMGEGKITPDFLSKLNQQKLAQAEGGVIERLTQKPTDRGVLAGTPLGSQMPTPLEEAISGKERIITPDEIKKMVQPEAKPVAQAEVGGVGKEFEPLAKEARKYENLEDFEYAMSKRRPFMRPEPSDEVKLQAQQIIRATGDRPRLSAKDFGGESDITVYRTGDAPIKLGDYVYATKGEAQHALEGGQGKKVYSKNIKAGDLIQAGSPSGEYFYSPSKLGFSSLEDFYKQATKTVAQPPISDKKPIAKEPTPEQIEKAQKREMAVARGEVKAGIQEKIGKGFDVKDFVKNMKVVKEGPDEGIWSVPKTGEGGGIIRWDEVSEDLGYTGKTTEINGVEINSELYEDLVMLKGGQPGEVKAKVIMPKMRKQRIAKLKDTAEALGLEKEFYKIIDDMGIDRKTIPSYKRLKPYRPAEAVTAKPTAKTTEKIAKKEVKAEAKTTDQLYKEWQESYKSETLSPRQALNKALSSAKKATDQGIKDRLDKEVAKLYGVDLRSPEFVFEKFGLKEKVYTPLKTGQEKVSKEIRTYTEKSNKWWKAIGKNNKQRKVASKKIFRWLDGDKSIQLTKGELGVAMHTRNYLAQWADRLGLPESKRITNYITHIFEPDFEGGKRIFPDELAKILDYITPNKEFNPFLEKRLGAKGYKEDVFEALDAYVYRGARKLYLDKPLNVAASYVDALPLQASRYVDKLLKRFKNRPSTFEKFIDQNLLQGLPPKVRNFIGNRPAAKLTNLLTTQIYRGTLGLNLGSAIKNLTQGVNTFAELGTKYTTIGYSQLMTRGVKELKDNEVMSDMIIADYKNTALRGGLRKLDNTLFWFFETAEKINRGSAYYGAKQKFLDEGLPEEEAITKAKEIVRKTQFAYGKLDTPLALQTPAGKLMFTLATYPLKQFEFIGGYARKREWAKLARYIASSFAIVALVGEYLGIDYEDVFVKNVMPTLGIVPKTIKNIAGPEWQRDKAVKNILKILTIPGYGGLKKVGQAARGESRTAPSKTYPKGQRRFKIETTEDIIKTLLSGEYSTSGAEDYLIKIGVKRDRTLSDDLLYLLTGNKEYAPKKK